MSPVSALVLCSCIAFYLCCTPQPSQWKLSATLPVQIQPTLRYTEMPTPHARVSSLWLLWPVSQFTPFLRPFSHSTLYSCSLCICLVLAPHPHQIGSCLDGGWNFPCNTQHCLWARKRPWNVCWDGLNWMMGQHLPEESTVHFVLHLCSSQSCFFFYFILTFFKLEKNWWE